MDRMCVPLVNFLTLALVHPTEEDMEPILFQSQSGIAAYVPGPAVVSHRREHLLYRDLLCMLPSATNAASDPALLDVARGVRDMVSESRAEQEDRANSRGVTRRPRTIRERLGDVIVDCLLLLCGLNNYEDPPAYHEWAARPRGVSDHWVLQKSVNATSANLGVPL
jgi:hypothetical protein